MHVSVGEVSGDHVRLRLHTAEGVAVMDDGYRQDGRLSFVGEVGRVVLVVDKVTNSLFGQDSVTLRVEMLTFAERSLIERTLTFVAASPLLFWRGPNRGVMAPPPRTADAMSGAAYARLLRADYERAHEVIFSSEDFVHLTVPEWWHFSKESNFVSRPDLLGVDSVAGWLREQIASLRAPAQTEARK